MMTRFQASQAISILLSAALVLATWLPTVSTPAPNAIAIAALA
jgi:hypothetical protein